MGIRVINTKAKKLSEMRTNVNFRMKFTFFY